MRCDYDNYVIISCSLKEAIEEEAFEFKVGLGER